MGDLGLNDLDSPPQPENRIWDVPLFDLDPNLGDSSVQFDAAGFDYRVGEPGTAAVDAVPLNGLDTDDMPTRWEEWRDSATDIEEQVLFYSGTAAGSWTDWEERMWYLINLFRIIHTDTSLLTAFPTVDQLGGIRVPVNVVSVNRLDLTP